MTGSRLRFNARRLSATSDIEVALSHLTIAGWTGRDRAAVEAHIEELAALGVPRPKATPLFYRVAAANLSQSPAIQVAERYSSGEVECVLIKHQGELWLGLGSDHTDRKLETVGVTLAKQVCAKPIANELWSFDDVSSHFDELVLRSWITTGGRRRLYQEGRAAQMLRPEELVRRMPGGSLDDGHAMFCGTLPVQGEIEFSDLFEMEVHDPVNDRSLRHSYAVNALPIEG
jgi:hypothetical protein